MVRDSILKNFPQLEEDDVKSTGMGQQGADVQLSPAATKVFPYGVECKSLAKFVGYGWYDQASAHVGKSKKLPLVVIKANQRKPLVIIDLEHFMELQASAYQNSL